MRVRIIPLSERGVCAVRKEYEQGKKKLKLGLIKVFLEGDELVVETTRRFDLVLRSDVLKKAFVEDLKSKIIRSLEEEGCVLESDYTYKIIEG